MKISICITVRDEEKSVAALLTSLLNQSLKPFEIVVVDGGSTDKTLQIVRHFAKKSKLIKMMSEPGSIAHGRNVSIEVARGDIIVTTDAGCVTKRTWLEKIITPLKHKTVGLVAGFYDMPYDNSLQEAARVYLGVVPQRFDPTTFLPSARSVAFRKSVWESVGGFNEKLDKGGEDTEFFFKCVKKNVKIVRVEEARVVWKELENMVVKDITKKFFIYAKGDGQAGIWWHPSKQFSSHNIKISLVFLRYIAGLILLGFGLFNPPLLTILSILFCLYLIFPIWKWRDVIQDLKPRLLLPVIQIISDIQVMRGFLSGTFQK
ncbi:glycosyltransferase [Candidatus Microgenomates bacterium]|nr:glycosyltransferase [Candidatus Microgenomates bacterium]